MASARGIAMVDDAPRWQSLGDRWYRRRIVLRQPWSWELNQPWWASHAVAGIEDIGPYHYARSLRLERGPAVVELRPSRGASNAVILSARVHSSDDLADAWRWAYAVLDAGADPVGIDAHLAQDPMLAPSVAQAPGLRVPRHSDAAEMLWRAILHQQVSTQSATAMASRLLHRFADELDEPYGSIRLVWPGPSRWAELAVNDLGLTTARATTMIETMRALDTGVIPLGTMDRHSARSQLIEQRGIGPWTAEIMALRVFGDPDAFTMGDLALRRAAAAMGIDDLAHHSLRWRPWRSYAMHHLWRYYAANAAANTTRRSG